MLKLKYLFIFFLLSGKGLLVAQSLEFEKFTTKSGLPSNKVYNIYQDHEGYLWIFAQYGVVKYNGSTFTPALKNLPFEELFVYSFYENKDGRKWVANSNAKIYEIINDSAYVVKGTEKISEELKASVSEITQLYVDDSLNIYAITKYRSYKFIKKEHYRPVNLSGLPLNKVLGYMVICKNNVLLPVCSDQLKKEFPNGFFHKTKKLRVVFKSDTGTVEHQLNCSAPIGPKFFKRYGNDIYLCFYDRIIKIDASQTVKETPIGSVITNFNRDHNGHLWVACLNNGLYELNEEDSVINHYFAGKTVNDVLIDAQNNLWLSTSGYGLYHCRNLNLLGYNEWEPLGTALSFIRQIGDELFVANRNGDLFTIDKNQTRLVKKSDDLRNEPMDIIKTGSLFLISSRFKVEYFDPKRGVVKTLAPEKDFYVAYKYVKLSNGSVLAIGKKNIVVLSGEKIIQRIDFNRKVFDGVERNGKVLISTESGVYELVNDQLIRPDYLKPTENIYISRIIKDKNNNYWFCTRGNGLVKLLPGNTFLYYNTSTGLPGNIINDVYFSENGIILSTNKGAFYTESASLVNWADLYPEEVLEAYYFNNKFYLSSQNGLVIINDKRPKHVQPLLYFHLVSVNVNSKQVNREALNHLHYNENNLEFTFDIILFNEDHKALTYKLTGGHLNYSTNTIDNKISLLNLAPDTYTLTVVPDTRIKSDAEITLVFKIQPAFWQTTWFLVLSSLLFIGVVIITGLVVVRRKRDKERKKNEVDKLILEYKLIALKAQINPHFMSNCLTAIQHMIVSNKVYDANLYIAKFSFLVRQVLNFSSRGLVKLSEELEITKLNMELELLRFENKFEFTINLGDSVDVNELLVPPLILQPIVENAIWHGLLPLKNIRTGKLHICVFIEHNMLCITVEDNGAGRRNGKEVIHNSKTSRGIQITRQRILNLNNLYGVQGGDLLYEDFTDEYGNSHGTLVKLVLPILNSFEYEKNKSDSY
jgi:ligand-binding sensor domain-containing protein